jgi:hypothetical protein
LPWTLKGSLHEDFDTALFGHYAEFLDQFSTLHPPTFEADGLFAGGEG